MIAKPLVAKDDLARLEALRQAHPHHARDIDAEIRKRRSGEKGERDAAHHIDSTLATSRNYVVLHDLRLETPLGVAQFDHVVVGRIEHFTILETKRFHAGVKITEQGEFLRWNDWTKRYEGMESPLMQCDRHERALAAYCEERGLMPRRLGLRIRPAIRSFVLVNPQATILRPTGYDTSRVVKTDQFFERMRRDDAKQGVFGAVGELARVLGADTVAEIARSLADAHRPARHDYAAMLGIHERVSAGPSADLGPTPTTIDAMLAPERREAPPEGAVICKACASAKGEIRHGRFGYYWKCLACDGNTKLVLPGPGRLRKDGDAFAYVDASGVETPFHVNGR